MRWGLRLTALAVLFFATTRIASAQDDPIPSLDIRNFLAPTDPYGTFLLEPATTPGHGNWNVGVYGSYAVRPLVLATQTGDETSVIEHQVSMDYIGNIGITDRLAVGLTIPTVVYQDGEDVADLVEGATALPAAAFGDATLTTKGTILSPGDLGGFGLAGIGRFYVPTGNRSSYVSDASVRGEIRVLGELQLLALAVRATAGARLRAAPQTYVDDGTDNYRFGHDLPWAAGITVRPQAFGLDSQGRWRWTIESRGAIGITPSFASGPQSPALIGASARYTVDEISAFAGVELPLNDAVGNPAVRPVLGIGWAPRFEDADEDGIEDELDECPELAEDRDGFQDTDGCPDFDNDDDGVPDEQDRCPAALEDADEFQDTDGCPDPDNDGDGVLDAEDACPLVPGAPTNRRPGCPVEDGDGDGIFDDRDACPDQAEDRDGFQDEDGCPDPDNDGDGILDSEDECPDRAGPSQPDTPYHGCPNPDEDGDTFTGNGDLCPSAAEDFDGIEDEDGCPDAGPGQPLVRVLNRATGPALLLNRPLKFDDGDLDPPSLVVLRAVGQLLNQHPEWIVAVGVRPSGPDADAAQEALNRSFTIALTLRTLTFRDSAAETIGWTAVQGEPGAWSGVGLMLFAPSDTTGATP